MMLISTFIGTEISKLPSAIGCKGQAIEQEMLEINEMLTSFQRS